jgi:hypothetical protein
VARWRGEIHREEIAAEVVPFTSIEAAGVCQLHSYVLLSGRRVTQRFQPGWRTRTAPARVHDEVGGYDLASAAWLATQNMNAPYGTHVIVDQPERVTRFNGTHVPQRKHPSANRPLE